MSPARSADRVVALAVTAAGGGLSALAGGPSWDSVTVTRVAPLTGFVVHVPGRTVEPAVIGLAVVALAAVVAILATQGLARRSVGAVVVLAGLLLGWRAAAGFAAVSPARARDLVTAARTGTTLDRATRLDVSVHPIWPASALVGAVLVVLGGVLVVLRADRWSALGSRYDAPTSPGPLAVAPAGVDAAGSGAVAIAMSISSSTR